MAEPQLAVNYIPSVVQTHLQAGKPLWMQPKVDGVRGGHYGDYGFTGRSLKPFANNALTQYWSHPDFKHLDGELILHGKSWTLPRLCSLVTSMTNTMAGHPEKSALIAFDWLADLSLPYSKRYALLEKRVERLQNHYGDRIQLMPFLEMKKWEEVLACDTIYIEKGLEGTILRDPRLPAKPGRSSKVQIDLWRIKRFIDFEVVVTRFDPAMENTNPAVTNRLGRTERSTHKAGLVPKKMVGTIYGKVLKDVKHDGKLLFKKGMEIAIGPGKMTHHERALYFAKPELLIGKIGKVKTLPTGVKEKPRMPTWETLRSLEDL